MLSQYNIQISENLDTDILLSEIVKENGIQIANNHLDITLLDCHTKDQDQNKEIHLDVLISGCKFNNENQIFIIINDITGKYELESMIKQNKQKDLVLANVTHDFKTPLNGMIAILELAQSNNNIQEIQQFSKIILNNCYLLLYLVNDILDYSRSEYSNLKLVIQEFTIQQVLQEIYQLIEFQIKAKKLNFQIINKSPPNLKLQSDKNRLKQIIINLSSNAIKFTFKGFIKIIVEQLNQKITQISIQDSGIGIPQEQIPCLFKTFGTYDNKGVNKDGVGLGLTICQRLVQLLGPQNQQISLQSQVGIGSTFTFQIFNNLLNNSNSQSVISNSNNHLIIPSSEKMKSLTNFQQAQKNYSSQQRISFQFQIKQFEKNIIEFTNEEQSERKSDQLSEHIINSQNREISKYYINPKFFFYQQFDIDYNQQQEEQKYESDEEEISYNNMFKSEKYILIVDDNSFNILSLKTILQQFKNVIIEEAYNGEQVLEKLQQREQSCQKQFDIIFIDVNMPIMDGIETIQIIRRDFTNLKDLKIITCTGYSEVQDIQKCINSGANAYLGKPITRDSCLQVLIELFL